MAVKSSTLSSKQYSSKSLELYKNGKWTLVSSNLERESLKTYEATAERIIEECKSNSPKTLKALAPYAEQLNTCWTTARLAQKVIGSAKKEKVVQFSSYSKRFSWLSNFFPTLILDFAKERILFHTEGGYVAFKVETFKGKEKISPERVVRIFDPKLCKHVGSEHRGTSPIDRALAVAEMERLVTLKFEQNPVLKQLLLSTGDALLEEHTSDSFWGTACGTLYTPDSNQLGKILTRLRQTLQRG